MKTEVNYFLHIQIHLYSLINSKNVTGYNICVMYKGQEE